jgi:tetratricopeptide (TPR) repeat protein
VSVAAASPPRRWLYGAAPDLLIGCGLWYAFALVVLALAGSQVRMAGMFTLMPFLLLAFAAPHYGATLLRVYQQREERQTYAAFAIFATAILAAVFVVGVHSAIVGSVVLTIYLTWSPWHYTGQNYGIATMFLRRRGVDLSGNVKHFVYASFTLSYVLVFLAMHSGARPDDWIPLAYSPVGYRFLSMGLPYASVTVTAAAIAYLVATVGAAVLLLRRASLRDIAPVGALALTQALWFSIPLILRQWHLETGIEPWGDRFGTYYFMWIGIGHSVQYLWITSYYARVRSDWTGQLPYYVKALLAGTAIWTIPTLVFAPNALGRLPFDAGLGILAASAVNLHHFILDGAIWKLRDGSVARILLRRRDPSEEATALEPPRRRWIAPAVWALGAISFAITFGVKWEREVGVRRAFASGDLARVESALERFTWVGRDSPRLRRALGRAFEERGNSQRAKIAYERALALYPSAPIWFSLAALDVKDENWAEAARAYEEGLKINPEREDVYFRLGLVLLELEQPERAREAFERAVALNPDREINRIMLERAADAAETREGRGS